MLAAPWGKSRDHASAEGRASTVWALLLCVSIASGTAAAIGFAAADPDARSVLNLDIDTSKYDRIAREVALTHGVGAFPAHQPPGFIALLAAVYAVFGPSHLAAKLVLCVLLSATAALTARLVWSHVGPLEAVVAGTLTIFSPLMVAYAACLQYEIPAAFASALVAVMLSSARGADGGASCSVARAAALGAACAGATLLREVLAVVFPIALAVVLWPEISRARLRRSALLAVVMIAAFATPIASWSAVQSRNFGRLTVLSDKADVNLRIGNNPAANGTYHVPLEPIGSPSGWDFIRAQPGEAAALAPRKVLYFWGLLRDPWTVSPRGALTVHRALGGLVPFRWSLVACRAGAMALLFAAGIVMLRHRPALWPMAAIVAALMAVHVLFFSSQRFSVPVQPQIHAIAALPLAAAIRALWRSLGRASLLAALALVGWMLAAQRLSFPGGYRLEAETLEGHAATNVEDSLSANGRARFGDASRGRRLIAFLPAEPLPRGPYTLKVRARAASCEDRSAPAISIAVWDEKRQVALDESFAAGVLCDASGYATLEASGVLPEDQNVDVTISSLGTVDLWVDSLEVAFGGQKLRPGLL